MRTTLSLALSLAALAGAMPLQKGNSWVWRVIDLRTNQIEYRSATVTESVVPNDSFPQGTLWTLAVHDSSSDRADTAKIIANGTSQMWSKGSSLLPIEPLPWNGTDVSWGRVAFASLRDQSTMESYSMGSNGTISGSWRSGTYTISSTIDAPRGMWSDSLGVERFRIQKKEWTLVKAGTKDISFPLLPTAVPDSGSHFEWQKIDTRITYPPIATTRIPGGRIKWEILSRTSDSSGFKVVSVRKTDEPVGESPTSEILRIAFNPTTKERLPARGDSLFLPDEAWYTDWTDTAKGDYRGRSVGSSGSSSGTLSTTSSSSSTWKLWRNHIDSLNIASSFSSNTSSSSANSYDLILLSINDSTIRTAIAPLKVAPRSVSSRPGLSEIAHSQPDAQVRWSDLQGRSGTSSLEQFLSSRPSGGVLHLTIRLRDGSTWQGTSLGLR